MGELIDSLFARIEFILLGAFGVALIAYLLAVYHPLKHVLLKYLHGLHQFWLGGVKEVKILHGVQIAVALGGLYYLGVMANATSYWVVEPVRFRILDCVFSDEARQAQEPAANCRGDRAAETPLVDAALLPFLHIPVISNRLPPISESSGRSNSYYLRAEARVDNQQNNNISGVLGDELNFIRLLRGTVLFSLGAAIATAIKITVVVVTVPLWLVTGYFYRALIDDRETMLKEQSAPGDGWLMLLGRRFSIAIGRIVVPQLIVLGLSLVLYATAMGGYRTTEFEYSRLVHDAMPAVQTNTNNVNAPTTTGAPSIH